MQDRNISFSNKKFFVSEILKKSDQGGVKNVMILFKDDSI